MYDERKVDDVVLALLHLNAFKDGGSLRAWKGFDWDALDRLYERGLISNPKSKAKSVVLSEEGARLAQELFEAYFGTAMSDQRRCDAETVLARRAAPGRIIRAKWRGSRSDMHRP